MVTAGRQWLARPDLSYPSLRIAVEYEGDTTAPTVANGARTSAGDALLEDAGWVVVEVTADDVYRYPDELLSRLRRLVAGRTG